MQQLLLPAMIISLFSSILFIAAGESTEYVSLGETCSCSGLDRGSIEEQDAGDAKCFQSKLFHDFSIFQENMVFVRGGQFNMGTNQPKIPQVGLQ